MILEKGVSPNVVKVKLDCSKKKEHWFLLRSDAHHDNPHCDWDLEKKHLDEALEREAGILDCGDLFCAMGGKWDPRSNKAGVRPEHQTGDYLDALVRTAADFYQPYAKNWVMFGLGNHETAISKRHESSLSDRLAQALRDRTGALCPVTGYTSWIKFQFMQSGRVATARTLWAMHGYGGGGPVTVDNIQAQRQNAYVEGVDIMWSGHCFSQDTEILTPGGWKTYDQLVIGSEVATMNKQTRKLEFQPVSMVHKHYGYDKMVSIKGQGTDLLVTADHGLVYTKRRMEHELRECKASEFQDLHEVTLPSSANYDGPGVPLSDDEIRLTVTIVADGNITEGPIRFHYAKDRKIQRTCQILDNLDIPYNVHVSEKTGKTKISVPVQESREWLARLSIDPKDKRLPDWTYHVSRKQALVVLHEYHITDGYGSNGTHMVACSNDKRNMDAVQSCAVKCGRRTSLRRGKKMYRLNVATKSGLYFAHARSEEVPHDGSLVWCVTVPNGTLIVRRNGCVTVTQNTHDRWAREFCKMGITQEGEVFQRNLWYVKSGSYKNEYGSGAGGWHIETGKPPKPLGAWWLKLTFFKKITKGVSHSNVLVELIPTN